MAPIYQVKLLQINVSQDHAGGDCAIILLLDASTTPYTVVKAVLVDGGDGPGTKTFLSKTMKLCEKKYMFADDSGKVAVDNPFKFDAISISHWDKVCQAPEHFLP